MVSASRRCAIRAASPAGVLAKWFSRRIWPFRLAKTLSITSRLEARTRSRRSVADVRSFAGVTSVVPQRASRARKARPQRPLSAIRSAASGAGEQISDRLVLLLVGRHKHVAERQATPVGDEHEADAVDVAMLGLGVAVAGGAGEAAARPAARVVGDADQPPVGEASTAGVEPAGQPLLHARE